MLLCVCMRLVQCLVQRRSICFCSKCRSAFNELHCPCPVCACPLRDYDTHIIYDQVNCSQNTTLEYISKRVCKLIKSSLYLIQRCEVSCRIPFVFILPDTIEWWETNIDSYRSITLTTPLIYIWVRRIYESCLRSSASFFQ